MTDLARRTNMLHDVLATLAYFHILSGIKHSSFFASTRPAALRPAYARLTDGEWVAVSQQDWAEAWKHPGAGVDAMELQQLVFTLDDKTVRMPAVFPRRVRMVSASCGTNRLRVWDAILICAIPGYYS